MPRLGLIAPYSRPPPQPKFQGCAAARADRARSSHQPSPRANERQLELDEPLHSAGWRTRGNVRAGSQRAIRIDDERADGPRSGFERVDEPIAHAVEIERNGSRARVSRVRARRER